MWRWVTRGLVFSFLALVAAATFAQSNEPTSFVGVVELPDPSVTQSGVVLVKGWAYDVSQISRIELYVDDQFQYDVNMGFPRIDIIEAYPQYPGLTNAAPGFQVGFLASRFSNGTHTVSLMVHTSDGQSIELGRRTITINNTLNQAPFGFVDIPNGGGIYNASGVFPVSGWAADTDGIAEVDVEIDGLIIQSAMYGDERPDVANDFPDFPAAGASGFVANVDSTRIEEGVHLLDVVARDTQGNSRLIGRRQIQVFNNDSNLKPFGFIDEPKPSTTLYGTQCTTVPSFFAPPTNVGSHVTPVRGWALDLSTRTDIGRVGYVELLIDGARWASTGQCGFSSYFGGYANCYGLPRMDVARLYPTYPDSPNSGFMFTLDVGALMALDVPPGAHVLKVRVGDEQGTLTELPSRDGISVNFTCADDNHDFASLGFIDQPQSFDYVGGNVTFQGWAVDENGGVSSVSIYVDGTLMGQASYGYARTDVQQVYPFITGSSTSGWRFVMDTTRLSNSRHRLTVTVTDSVGNNSTIGSVDFYVQNPH